MKKIKLNIPTSRLIILSFLILAVLNYSYYEYVYKKFKKKYNYLRSKLTETNSQIYQYIDAFNKKMKLFRELSVLEKNVIEQEYENEYLKKRIKSKKDILGIFKTLVLQSNIKLKKIEIKSEKIENQNGIITFNFYGISTLENFLELLDMIEGKREFLEVESYNLSLKKGNQQLINIDMKLKFIYMISNE